MEEIFKNKTKKEGISVINLILLILQLRGHLKGNRLYKISKTIK